MKVNGTKRRQDRLYRKLRKLDRKMDRLELKILRVCERLGLYGHRGPSKVER